VSEGGIKSTFKSSKNQTARTEEKTKKARKNKASTTKRNASTTYDRK